MPDILIKNATVWDGSGAAAAPGTVSITDGRIEAVIPASEPVAVDGARVVDATGLFLMPGMIEGHGHLSFIDQADPTELALMPPEEHTLATMHNAKTLLDAGFTSVCSAASAKPRLDVVIRNEIDAGRIPGPRVRAGSPEITVTSGLGDSHKMHMRIDTFGMVADGPEDLAAVVRLCIREGVDNVKINISGDVFLPYSDSHSTVMNEPEVRMAVETAHDHGRQVAAHCRSAGSVKRAVKCGVDLIYHCDHADEEALDMLEGAKDRVVTGPAIGVIISSLEAFRAQEGPEAEAGIAELSEVLENSCRAHREMLKRGIPIVAGGDYGFAVNRQGENARDLEHFVEYFGFTSSQALEAATRVGARAMRMQDELGQIKPGFLADLLLVDGDPLDDVSIMQDRSRFKMIMQEGDFYRLDPGL